MRHSTPALLALSLLLSACSRTGVEGTVRDAWGRPLPQAEVKVDGQAFQATSDEKGLYRVDYTPGVFKVAVRKPGHTSAIFPVNATEKRLVPAGDVTLYPLPTEIGAYALGPTSPVKLPAIPLVRRQVSAAGAFELLVGPAENPPALPAGALRVLDLFPGELGLTPLDDERLVARVTITQNVPRWEKARFLKDNKLQMVGDENMRLVTANVTPGLWAWVGMQRTNEGLVPGESAWVFRVDGPASPAP